MSPAQFVGSLLGCCELDTMRAVSKLRGWLAASGYIGVRGGRVKVCPLYARGRDWMQPLQAHPTAHPRRMTSALLFRMNAMRTAWLLLCLPHVALAAPWLRSEG